MIGQPNKRVYSLITILFLSVIGIAFGKAARTQQPTSQDDTALRDAIRKGGLREAARIKGHYVGIMKTGHWAKLDLESLTKYSAAIIVGTPEGSASRLSDDGEVITTEYKVKVKESLKGALTSDQLVTISLPGGKVVFADGTSATINTPDIEGMVEGRTYVFFLSPHATPLGALTLTADGQGLFELSGDGQGVKRHGDKVDSVQKHKGETIEAFRREIETAVQKYPEI